MSYGIPATLNVCPLVPPQYCGWVPGMQVTVGQVYLMYISNWSQSSLGFSLGWTLRTAPVSIAPCSPSNSCRSMQQ